MKFSRKNFENWRFWKMAIFEKRPFWIFFSKKKFFFCFILMKISPNLHGRMDGLKFWCFPWFPENSLLCVILRYTVYTKKLGRRQNFSKCFLLVKTEIPSFQKRYKIFFYLKLRFEKKNLEPSLPAPIRFPCLVEQNCTVYTYTISCLSKYGSIFLFHINK